MNASDVPKTHNADINRRDVGGKCGMNRCGCVCHISGYQDVYKHKQCISYI